uniref:STI1 domain-containing protein n=1 Tax=Strigamia maritima TaxID=126957 RepID=T1JK65_STRMM
MREEREQAAKEAQQNQGDNAGGAPRFGGMGGGMPDLSAIFNDPEIMVALQDPDVAAAFQDISSNPANFAKYQNNPKVATVMNKMAEKMGGAGMGAGGRFPGGFPGFTA